MAFKVAQIEVVVRGEVAYCVVGFCGGVDDGLGVMCESGEMTAVFLGEQGLLSPTFTTVVELKGLIAQSCQKKFAAIIEG